MKTSGDVPGGGALLPAAQTLFDLVDQRVEARLRRAGVGDAALDGDAVSGALTLKPLTLLLTNQPDPLPVPTVVFHSTTYPARVRAWEIVGDAAGSLTLQIATCPVGAYPALAWTTLGTATLAGTAWHRDPALAGWAKDGRGWVVVPAQTRWKITVSANSGVATALLLVDLEYLPEGR